MRAPGSIEALVCSLLMLGAGCAGTIHVKPSPPPKPLQAAAGPPVSLFLASSIADARVLATTPSGDVGLGDLEIDAELGPALVDVIQQSAEVVFVSVQRVEVPACAGDSGTLFEASLAGAPYIQPHWRGQTPRVGGGTVAEVVVRIIARDCSGGEVFRGVAYGFGRDEHLQTVGNWPGEEDFRPGIERALDDLQLNLVDLFRDAPRTRSGS